MAQLNKTDLKAIFKKGAIPTEAQFASLIDSQINTVDTSSTAPTGSSGLVESTVLSPANGFFNLRSDQPFIGLVTTSPTTGSGMSMHAGFTFDYGEPLPNNPHIKTNAGFDIFMDNANQGPLGGDTQPEPLFRVYRGTAIANVGGVELLRLNQHGGLKVIGAVTSSAISASGAITAGSITATTFTGTISSSGNIITSNITASGAISASGNLIVGGESTFNNDITVPNPVKLYLGGTSGMHIYSEGTSTDENQIILAKTNNLRILNQAHGKDIIFGTENASGTAKTPLTLSGSGDAVFGGEVTLGTALSVSNGGTGRTTLTDGAILIGNGTSAIENSSELSYDSSSNTLEIGGDNFNTKIIQRKAHSDGLGGALRVIAGNAGGTNQAGGDMEFRSGKGTGNAAGGAIEFYVSTAGSSGATAHATQTVDMTITDGQVAVDGNITVTGTVDGVDIAARDHDAVTLANTNYLSLSGQQITGGTVPVGSGGTGTGSFVSGHILRGNGTGTLTSNSDLQFDGNNLNIQSDTSTKPRVSINSTNSDAEAPELVLKKGTTGTDGDDLGKLIFGGFDSDGNEHTFAQALGEIVVAANGSEEGKLTLSVASHDAELQPGLIIASGDVEDEVDVTLGNGVASIINIPGNLKFTTDNTDHVIQQHDGNEVARIHDGGATNADTDMTSVGFGLGYKIPVMAVTADGGDKTVTLDATDSGTIIQCDADTNNIVFNLPVIDAANKAGIHFTFVATTAVNASKTIKINTSGTDGNDKFLMYHILDSDTVTVDIAGDTITFPNNAPLGTTVKITCLTSGASNAAELWLVEAFGNCSMTNG